MDSGKENKRAIETAKEMLEQDRMSNEEITGDAGLPLETVRELAGEKMV